MSLPYFGAMAEIQLLGFMIGITYNLWNENILHLASLRRILSEK